MSGRTGERKRPGRQIGTCKKFDAPMRDKEMELQALDEIAQAIEEMKKRIREEKGDK